MDATLTPQPRRLIGFAGHAGSGKSLAASTLLALGWKRVKFADALKEMLATLYRVAGLSEEDIQRRLEGDLKEEPDPVLNGGTPRWAMQTLGTEWGRSLIHGNLWVSIWTQAVIKAMQEGQNVIVDDVRFVNEFDAVHRLGGSVVMIVRPLSMVVTSSHISEKFEFEPDTMICNDKGPEELVAAVHELVVR